MGINEVIAEELYIKKWQVDAVIEMLDDGNTIPFIARYRKEKTGALNDEQLRLLHERFVYLRNLEEKKQQIMTIITEQGHMTLMIKKAIEQAKTQVELEDIYRPFKPKRRTKAMIAKDKGLEPLAKTILDQNQNIDLWKEAELYINKEKEILTAEEAIIGAQDIIAEKIAEEGFFRQKIRENLRSKGKIVSKAKNPESDSVYEQYYNYEEMIFKIPGHRILAINRGEKEKILSVSLEIDDSEMLRLISKKIIHSQASVYQTMLRKSIEDSYKRLIYPSVEREIRAELTERAEEGAMIVFGKNLKQLLLQAPITGHTVLGWDPAFRTGCKLAVVDATGKVLDTAVIYPIEPHNKVEQARKTLTMLIKNYHISLISLGNGTASRESEQFIVSFLKDIKEQVSYAIVNEAGASVYSASETASIEFPQYDVGQRSAISIARRLQDPMAELVKIDPKAIGIGQYQHDMNQKKLESVLDGTVEDCVNSVGVDLNTASASLLSYVSGINKTIAKNIVSYREENGMFYNRAELLRVPKLGKKAYEQCAGFLRIQNGNNILDRTGIHPESYEAVRQLLKLFHININSIKYESEKWNADDYQKISKQLAIGEMTLRDIVQELKKPGRDPRENAPKPILRTDVLEMKDLKEGMILKGTVRNVIDFGAFVDIGVHQDGLVHISKITKEKFIKHPLEAVNVGDIVDVKIISVDLSKKRIQLTMIL